MLPGLHPRHSTLPCRVECLYHAEPFLCLPRFCLPQRLDNCQWAWNAVNCEPVVACGSELGWHFYAVRQFAVWHN